MFIVTDLVSLSVVNEILIQQMKTYVIVFEHLPMIYKPYKVSIYRLFLLFFNVCTL